MMFNKANDISYMFYNCHSLSSLPELSRWKIKKDINKSFIFYGCNDSLNIPSKFK